MTHPEILIVPVLMLADYFLTMYAASLLGGDPERRATYELNPHFKDAVAQGRLFHPFHLIATALATLAMWFLADTAEPEMFRGVLGAVVGAWSVLIGTHLANILLLNWLQGSPGAIEGKVSTSVHFRLMNTSFLSLGLAVVPLTAAALYEPGPFVIGAAIGASLVAVMPLIRKAQTDPGSLDQRLSGGRLRTCSFCGRSETELALLIEAERANICDECVATCSEAIVEAKPAEAGAKPAGFGRKAQTPQSD